MKFFKCIGRYLFGAPPKTEIPPPEPAGPPLDIEHDDPQMRTQIRNDLAAWLEDRAKDAITKEESKAYSDAAAEIRARNK